MDIHYFRKKLECKKIQQQETFNFILDKCHSKMKMALEKGFSAIYYEIPEFVIGKPVYNLNDCIEYMQACLVKNGFTVKYYFPRVIMVSWHNALDTVPIPKQIKQNEPKVNSDFVKCSKPNKNKKLTLEM